MIVKSLLFFVLLISYFPNSYGGTRAAKRILEGLRRVAEAALVEGRYSRPDEPSAWSVRFINLDCRLTSDWDVAEGSRAAVQPNSAAGGHKRPFVFRVDSLKTGQLLRSMLVSSNYERSSA